MTLEPTNGSTGQGFGFSTQLRRHHASYAHHENYGKIEFLRVLSGCHQNLGIEGRADSPAPEYNDSGELVNRIDMKIDWEPLRCQKCKANVKNTESLMDHIVIEHGMPNEQQLYKDYKIVSSETQKQIDMAVEVQASCSYVKKKFENSNDLLICPVDSPLCQFLVMRHLLVYFQEAPPKVEGIALKMKMADMSYTVVFVFGKVERTRRRIKQKFEEKARNKKIKELEAQCDRSWIPENDVMLKKSRTTEENRVLTKALKLPLTCSHEDILRKAREMKQKREEERNNVYSATVKSDGQLMSAEEKKLISSLASGFMKPLAEKRKTTYKNPSELLKKKQQEQLAKQKIPKVQKKPGKTSGK